MPRALDMRVGYEDHSFGCGAQCSHDSSYSLDEVLYGNSDTVYRNVASGSHHLLEEDVLVTVEGSSQNKDVLSSCVGTFG